MASIVGKKQGGQTYYYLVESARVGGRPRIVSQQYLGSAAEVAAKLAGTPAGEPALPGGLATLRFLLDPATPALVLPDAAGSSWYWHRDA